MAATGSGGFAVVAAGISEALIATAAGLVVGVLSIFAYNAFMVRINNHIGVLREWADEFLLQLVAPPAREGSHPVSLSPVEMDGGEEIVAEINVTRSRISSWCC